MEKFKQEETFTSCNFVLHAGTEIQFISPYQGKTVTALIGSSVNFTWSFSGGSKGVESVSWGLKADGSDRFINNGILVFLDQSGNPVSVPSIPTGYPGRVSGSRSGNIFSGQVLFTLSSIKKDDKRYYGCRIDPVSAVDVERFDHVYLFVQGG